MLYKLSKVYIFLFISVLLLLLLLKKNTEYFKNSNKSLKLSYVITLPDRKKYIQKIMPGFEIKPIILPASLKNNLNKEKLIKNKFLSPESKLNMGQIACHHSHIKALKTFLQTSEPWALIFEDDIEPAKKINYNIKIANILKNVPANFDLIYLGRCYDKCRYDQIIVPGLVRCFYPLCRHSYIVSRKGARYIINNTLPLKIQGDNTIANLILKKKLIAYASKPALFYQNRKELKSNLNNNDTLRECL